VQDTVFMRVKRCRDVVGSSPSTSLFEHAPITSDGSHSSGIFVALSFPLYTMKHCNTNRLAILAVAALYQNVDAFTTPFSQVSTLQQLIQDRSGPLTLKAKAINDNEEDILQQQAEQFINPLDQFSKPIITAATSTLLATSLLFSNPLLPTPDAQAAAIESQASTQSKTATSIEIDLSNTASLTRKAFINRDKLTNYLIDSFKSFKPILDLLSDSDTVTADIKGAVNNALSNGDAQFIVNGESVDVRIESVPGVVIVKVINPAIPRLPFLKDGSASLKFVDEIVDVAPLELEKTAREVQSIENFLTWGSYSKPPISYKGSSLDYWLSSKFIINGQTISLGSLGEMTNSEVVVFTLGSGVGLAYASSYSYYMKLQREQEEKDAEKKKQMAEKKKKAAAAKKKQAVAKKDDADAPVEKKAVETKNPESKKESVKEAEVKKEDTPPAPAKKEESSGETDTKPKGRKRDAIKNIFRKGK